MSNTIVGVDPGPEVSHAVVLEAGLKITDKHEYVSSRIDWHQLKARNAVFEDFVPTGARLGYESIRTIKVVGVAEYHGLATISRPDVKAHFFGKSQGINDALVRDYLIERFGPGKSKAIGTKKEPGPLYSVTGHFWAALAVAVVAWDRMQEQ